MTLTNGRTSAYQWDYGLKAVTTEAAGTVARFANEHGSKAIPVEAVSEVIGDVLKVVYHIPDILLTTGRAIVMYHLGGDGETSVYTTSEDFLPVNEAPKPDDYIYTEEEIRTWQELDERLTEAEEDIVALESGKADVVHTHTESDITDLKDYVVEPTSDGTNGQVLTTNGSGGRSWASIPTEVLRVVFTQSGGTVTADQTYDTIYAAISAGKDVFGLLNGKVYYFGGVSSGAVMEFYAQDIFTASTGEIKVTTRNIGMNSGNSVVYTETERLFAPKSHTHAESDITDLGPYIPLPESASLGDSLVFGGTEWTAGALTYSDVGAAASSHTHTESDITNLGDYISDPSTKSEGQVLTYNGSTWVAADGGGGGGTSDYTELSNKPSINSTTLSGNKTSSDLGLAAASHTHTASEVGAIANPSTRYEGQVLTYDGSSWVAEDLPAETEEIFVANASTTYAQLTAARTAGKTLLFYISITNDNVTNSYWYSLDRVDNDGVFWFYSMKDTETLQWWSLGSTGVWSGGSKDFVPQNRTINSKQLNSNITLTASDVGAVPTTRTVNSKALSSDITLSASDVGAVPTTRKVNNVALSSDVTLGAADVGAIAAPVSPTSGDVLEYSNSAWRAKALAPADIGAMPAPYSSFSPNEGDIIIWDSDNGRWAVHTPEPSDVGAAAASHTHTESDITDLGSYVPTSRKVNNKALSADITLSASDVSAVPTTRTINGLPLSSNIVLGIETLNNVSVVSIGTNNTDGGTSLAGIKAVYSSTETVLGRYLGGSILFPLRKMVDEGESTDYALFEGIGGDGHLCMYKRTATKWEHTDYGLAAANHTHTAADVGAMELPYSPFVPNDGEILVYSTQRENFEIVNPPYTYVIALDPYEGLPTADPDDVFLQIGQEGRPFAVTNGEDWWAGVYVAGNSFTVAKVSGTSASTMTFTYDDSEGEWTRANNDWSFVPSSRTVNGKALSSNISLTSSDVGAIANPSSKTTGQFLSWNGSAWVAASLPVWNGSVT